MQLDTITEKMVPIMYGKGYRYLVQFISEHNLMGNPVFFKTTRDLNAYSDGVDVVDVEWVLALEEVMELQTDIIAKIASEDSYRKLHDAEVYEDVLAPGQTEIWYVRPDVFRHFINGSKYLEKKGVFPTVESIPTTHVLLGKVKSNNKDELFTVLQGERWSPNGEAARLIKSKKLGHTSMSVGDIVRIGKTFWFCDSSKWVRIE